MDKNSKVVEWPNHLKLAILLGLISFAIYANTIRNGYVLDDFMVIKHDSIVTKGISSIPEIFSSPYLVGSIVAANDHYKPLSLAMFAIEYQVFDGTPGISHVVNVLLFSCCVILLFLFLYALFDRKDIAVPFVASLLFALHPINTEVVANIKSRDQLLCFFFCFLALVLFLKYARSGKATTLFLGAFSFFLSLISKETSITFLAVIPLIFFFYRNENRERSLYITASSLVCAAAFLMIRYAVLSKYHIINSGVYSLTDNPIANAPSTAIRLATAISVLGNYLRLLLVPYPLCCDYSYNNVPFVGFGNAWVLIAIAVYVGLTATCAYRLIKYAKDQFALAFLLFIVPLSVSCNIIVIIGAAMAERLLFFSVAGFCLAVALVFERLLPLPAGVSEMWKSKKVLATVGIVAIIYAVITIDRNADWKDNYTLYKTDVVKAPNDARLYFFVGNELFKLSETDNDIEAKRQFAEEGIVNFRKSLAIYPAYSDAHAAIANGYSILSEYDSAAYHYKLVDPTNINHAVAIHNLAGIYFNEKKYEQALELCKQVIVTDSKYMDGYKYTALCYMHLKQYDSAITVLYKAVAIDPLYNASYENLALAYKLEEKKDSALKYEAIAQQQDPGFRVL